MRQSSLGTEELLGAVSLALFYRHLPDITKDGMGWGAMCSGPDLSAFSDLVFPQGAVFFLSIIH